MEAYVGVGVGVSVVLVFLGQGGHCEARHSWSWPGGQHEEGALWGLYQQVMLKPCCIYGLYKVFFSTGGGFFPQYLPWNCPTM